MSSSKSIIVAIVVLVLASLGWWYIQQSNTSMTNGTSVGKEEQASPSVATGNVDDAVNSVLLEASADAAVFGDESADSAVLQEDTQAISDFGQTYDEKQF